MTHVLCWKCKRVILLRTNKNVTRLLMNKVICCEHRGLECSRPEEVKVPLDRKIYVGRCG